MVSTISFFFLSISFFYAQNEVTVQASQAVYLGKTRPLGDASGITLGYKEKKDLKKKNWPKKIGNFKGNTKMENVNPNALPLDGDPVRQIASRTNTGEEIEVLVNRDGIRGTQTPFSPPDPVGAVGKDHYVQLVNATVVLITDKDGNTTSAPFSSDIFWGSVNSSGAGDPMILWDHIAERWFILEFGSDFTSMLVGISDDHDPAGQYTAYKINAPGLPDYPKIGIWSTGYYITTNEFTSNFIPTYLLDREAMLAGNPVLNFQRILGIPKFGSFQVGFQVASAVHWDGDTPPPTTTPMMAVRMHDDAWGGGSDRIEIFEFTPDFDNPNNTIVNGPILIPTAPFDSDLCQSNIFDCLPQGNGSTISAMEQVIMFRPQYRNFGSHETIVLNFAVDVDGNNHAGIRWMELRKTAAFPWYVHQEGTYAPDELNRFMGAMAMDANGSIALGYTIMGENTFPSSALTGRCADDPLGEMTFNEIIIGEGQSWNGTERWGDYAAMTVDPVDQTTFWITNEYAGANSNWATKIASFKINRRDTFDMAAQALITPISIDDYTATETVTGRFVNTGISPISDFSVGFLLDNVLIEKVVIPETLQPDSSLVHIFENTVDMSAVRDYQLKLFTDLEMDGNVFNDTLRSTLQKIPRFDVIAERIDDLSLQICETPTIVNLVLKNGGTQNLTSATYFYSINGNVSNPQTWTGNLAMDEEASIEVELSGFLLNGENNLSFTVTEPNGFPDERSQNNTFNRTFNIVSDGIIHTLTIQLDNFPQESSWVIVDQDGIPIHQGGNYSAEMANSLIVERLCIPEGCFTFIFSDSGGDGICCNAGNGFYEFINPEGFTLARGDDFGAIESDDFCSPFMCSLEVEVGVNKETAPGANDGAMYINANSSGGFIEYSIDGGVTFLSTPFFTGLGGGDYEVVVKDEQECMVEVLVTLNTCTLSFTAEVEGVSEFGASDGSITITADSPFTPIQYSIDGGSTYQDSPIFDNLPEGEYDIEVLDAQECSVTETVTISTLTDIHTTVYGNRIKLNPNPTTGLVEIAATGFSDALIIPTQIIDMTGKIVQRGELTRFNETHLGIMSVHNYPAGVYFLRLDLPGNDPLFKIIKQ